MERSRIFFNLLTSLPPFLSLLSLPPSKSVEWERERSEESECGVKIEKEFPLWVSHLFLFSPLTSFSISLLFLFRSFYESSFEFCSSEIHHLYEKQQKSVQKVERKIEQVLVWDGGEEGPLFRRKTKYGLVNQTKLC